MKMPRYFFHVVAGQEKVSDLEGSDLPDLDAARAEALEDARSHMSNAILAGWDISDRAVEIRDEDDNLLLTVAFKDAFARRD
jgi:hypothetical protein